MLYRMFQIFFYVNLIYNTAIYSTTDTMFVLYATSPSVAVGENVGMDCHDRNSRHTKLVYSFLECSVILHTYNLNKYTNL